MDEPDRDDKIQVLRAKKDTWEGQNPVLLYGEHGLEKETGKFKVGDGNSRWLELDYFIPEAAVLEAIQTAIDALPPSQGGGEVSIAMLNAHINSLTPHPIYDDGESFVGIYRNAKV